MCELEWNRALLTMVFSSGTDVSIPTIKPQDIMNIHHKKLTKIVINCNKLS